jgi:carboxypeptidase Q
VRTGLLQTIGFALLLWIAPLTAQPPATWQSAAPAVAPGSARPEPVDLDAIHRIRDEGLQRPQVIDTAWYLTDVYGPRLTNSPGIRAAADWAVDRLREWGLSDVRQESWGPFGRGWVNERLTAHALAPQAFPLTAYARAWTPGTGGAVTADAVLAVIDREEDFAKWEGRLEGRIVLAQRPAEVQPLLAPLGRRYTDEELKALESQPVTAPRPAPAAAATPTLAQRRMQFYATEGVVAVLEPGTGRSDHGALLVTGPHQQRQTGEPAVAAQIVVATEQYNRLARLLARDVPVRLELDVRNRFLDEPLDSFNILADIPGTDRAGEVVMLGAHFDSWHAGTGATDNAAGSAVMMEAMRILRTVGLPMRRTVRLALWTGEEQGLLGSRAYVRQHFADRTPMGLQPGHSTLSAYFNLDNGTGAIRGVFLQGNDAVAPIFAAWMDPLRSLGVTTLSIRNTGSTDHVPFDEVGLPGFQFIQDPLEYGTHSHHSNMDLYDRLQAEDLMKNAIIVASFVYHAANRDDLLPRKPLPRPRETGEDTAR